MTVIAHKWYSLIWHANCFIWYNWNWVLPETDSTCSAAVIQTVLWAYKQGSLKMEPRQPFFIFWFDYDRNCWLRHSSKNLMLLKRNWPAKFKMQQTSWALWSHDFGKENLYVCNDWIIFIFCHIFFFFKSNPPLRRLCCNQNGKRKEDVRKAWLWDQ